MRGLPMMINHVSVAVGDPERATRALAEIWGRSAHLFIMFITLEDKTGIASLVVWSKVFEAKRRIVLSAGMIAVRGGIQREARSCTWCLARPARRRPFPSNASSCVRRDRSGIIRPCGGGSGVTRLSSPSISNQTCIESTETGNRHGIWRLGSRCPKQSIGRLRSRPERDDDSAQRLGKSDVPSSLVGVGPTPPWRVRKRL